MVKKKTPYLILLFPILAIGLLLINGGCAKPSPQETDHAKTFKVLKTKMTDPKTGLPETLDPNLIKGEDRKGYQIAKEIPEILAQLPCFCGCDAVGHENLLDCFVDDHGVGWGICQEEALLSKKLYDQKIPIEKIKEEIIKKFKWRVETR